MTLSAAQRDRAAGALLGLACGDALGAGYEFQPRVPYTAPIGMVGGGSNRWAPGEWTDDTDMALVIADVAHERGGLDHPAALDDIVTGWGQWSAQAKDVGIQTSQVLAVVRSHAGKDAPAEASRTAAASLHDRTGLTAGNGSLMRTAPVALAYLDDPDRLWQRAHDISALTHHDPVAGEACALWCMAIRHAVLAGDYTGLRDALRFLPADRRSYWRGVLDAAESAQPWTFDNNGWVVAAMQAAWSAITHTPEPPLRPDVLVFPAQAAQAAIERAVRAGGDADTVAAIAGSLVGARWGMSALPARWVSAVHGYPGYRGNHLQHLAYRLIDHDQRPLPGEFDVSTWDGTGALGSMAQVPGLILGGQAAFRRSAAPRAVSLARVGVDEAPQTHAHAWVWVIDTAEAGVNRHLHFQYHDVARLLDEWLQESDVMLHCVQAQNRTPCFAAAYLVLRRGMRFNEAVAAVRSALPDAHMHDYLLDPVKDFPSSTGDTETAHLGQLLAAVTPDGEPMLCLRHDGGSLRRRGGVWTTWDADVADHVPAPHGAVAAFDEAEMAVGVAALERT